MFHSNRQFTRRRRKKLTCIVSYSWMKLAEWKKATTATAEAAAEAVCRQWQLNGCHIYYCCCWRLRCLRVFTINYSVVPLLHSQQFIIWSLFGLLFLVKRVPYLMSYACINFIKQNRVFFFGWLSGFIEFSCDVWRIVCKPWFEWLIHRINSLINTSKAFNNNSNNDEKSTRMHIKCVQSRRIYLHFVFYKIAEQSLFLLLLLLFDVHIQITWVYNNVVLYNYHTRPVVKLLWASV